MPLDDEKNAHCKPFNYVELTDIDGEYLGLYRILPSKTRKLAMINEVQYECEHVLSTLLNDVLFRYHERINRTTSENIEYILARQTTKHWRLGRVEIERRFHYKWENENGLLGALFSIVEPFDEPYEWTWDTQEYPWTLNLVKPETRASGEIRYGKNLAQIEWESDPSNIVNRLYPLGYGEGVNQLDITRVNGGIEYIENAQSIAKYGLQSYVWVDRRFEDDESLLASARKFLEEWSVPEVSCEISAIDLSSLTGLSIDKLTVGKLIRVHDPDIGTFDARIVGESKADIVEKPYDIKLTLTNRPDSAGKTLSDIERRQEINEVYAQGATNMLVYTYEDNADAQHPAIIRFKLPDEMVRINKLELTFETSEFRAYSRAIEGGGAVVGTTKSGGSSSQTSSSGGGTTATSSSGGGTSKSTSSGGGTSRSTLGGGGSTQTASTGGAHKHELYNVPGAAVTVDMRTAGTHSHTVSFPAHTHDFSVPAHSHDFSTPNHTHTVNVPNHTHTVNIPAHTHEINLPDHTHAIEHGIFKLDRRPSRVTIKVDGKPVSFSNTSANSFDLIPHLETNSDNRVKRGWHTVEIAPNDLGRITAELLVQFFIQSRGGVDA